jgi:hypothetical protein
MGAPKEGLTVNIPKDGSNSGIPTEDPLRQTSIDGEPRTLSDPTIQSAKEAAKDIMETENVEPESDIFTKDAIDVGTRENVSLAQQLETHVGNRLVELAQKGGKMKIANENESEVGDKTLGAMESEP